MTEKTYPRKVVRIGTNDYWIVPRAGALAGECEFYVSGNGPHRSLVGEDKIDLQVQHGLAKDGTKGTT